MTLGEHVKIIRTPENRTVNQLGGNATCFYVFHELNNKGMVGNFVEKSKNILDLGKIMVKISTTFLQPLLKTHTSKTHEHTLHDYC